MRLRILDSALENLDRGRVFYERQGEGLGAYLLDSLFAEIDSLVLYTGIHRKVFGLCSKNRGSPSHAAYDWPPGKSAFGSSNQKRLPFPNSDWTPTCPPMRSTAARTMASPMPVPG
jgi:hypothetical protein